MRKKITTIALTIALSMGTCLTAFAGWEQTGTTWKYQTNGTYYSNCWQWIDSNGDGTAESYYFDGKGNMLSSTTIDGYMINADGKWILDGVIQIKKIVESEGTNLKEGEEQVVQGGDGYQSPHDIPNSYWEDMTPEEAYDAMGGTSNHPDLIVDY